MNFNVLANKSAQDASKKIGVTEYCH